MWPCCLGAKTDRGPGISIHRGPWTPLLLLFLKNIPHIRNVFTVCLEMFPWRSVCFVMNFRRLSNLQVVSFDPGSAQLSSFTSCMGHQISNVSSVIWISEGNSESQKTVKHEDANTTLLWIFLRTHFSKHTDTETIRHLCLPPPHSAPLLPPAFHH